MLDRERSILGQAVMKSLLQSGKMPFEIEAAKKWVDDLFPYFTGKIEAYAKLEAPLNEPRAPQSHLSDEKVAESLPPPNSLPSNFSSRNLPLKDLITSISVITEKEYKPKKFRYGIKGLDGNWYSTFFKNHFTIAQEAKNKGKQVRILFEVGEYNNKPQYTIQSIDIL